MKSEKKKKDYNQIEDSDEAFDKFKRNFVKQSLRRASYRWPFKHMERAKCRVDRGLYTCKMCKQSFGPKELNSDHIESVESLTTGFTDFNNYIDRLFVKSSGFQTLCLDCHLQKTQTENQLRIMNKLKPIKNKVKKKKK